jgi:hypothetical protein
MRNEEMQFKVNDWSDLEQIVERYPSLNRMLDKAQDFDDAKNILLRYFNSSTYLAAHFNKEKPLIKAQLQLPKSIDFSFDFYQWLDYRAREDQKEHIIRENAFKDKEIEPEHDKPTFLDRIKRMFSL